MIHITNDKPDVVAQSAIEYPTEPVIDHGPQGDIPVKPAGMSDNDYAGKLIAEARALRGVGDYPKAVQLLNAVLGLSSNSYSQDAQELIANSREKMGEMAKAKAEYETYLKLYPAGEGAVRAAQRIAVIDGANKFNTADKSTVAKS